MPLSCHAGLINEIRFRVVWGAGKMTREEIEGVGFEWCDCSEMMQVKESLAGHGGVVDSFVICETLILQRYDKDVLVDGMNTMPGE